MAACAAMALAPLLTVAAADERQLAKSERWYRAERAYKNQQYEQALPAFAELAVQSWKPAMAMAGGMYWQGQGAPADRPRGYALVSLAADRGDPIAQNLQRSMAAELSGPQLIEAERLAHEYGARVAAESERETALAMRLLRLEVDPAAAGREGGGNCTRRIPSLSAQPSTTGDYVRLRLMPLFPPDIKVVDHEQQVLVAMHVGRNGEVCYSVALEYSTSKRIDDAAVEPTRIWRLNPARIDGKPVESLLITHVTFQK